MRLAGGPQSTVHLRRQPSTTSQEGPGGSVGWRSGGGVDMPGGARIAADQPFKGRGGAVHQPDRGLAIGLLPQDVGFAVAVVIAGADNLPARSRVGPDPLLAERGGAVHQPDRRLTVGVLPQDVGVAIAVEITGTDD